MATRCNRVTHETAPTLSLLDMYDLVYSTCQSLGTTEKFLAEFGSRDEYAKKVGAF